MLLKCYCKGYETLNMSLSLDWEKKELSISVKGYGFKEGSFESIFAASDFDKAIDFFDKKVKETEEKFSKN